MFFIIIITISFEKKREGKVFGLSKELTREQKLGIVIFQPQMCFLSSESKEGLCFSLSETLKIIAA